MHTFQRSTGSRWTIVCCTVLCSSLASTIGGATDDLDRLYVIDGLGETLSLIDRAGDSVAINILTLGLVPNRIQACDGRLLVVNSTSDDLWVIDPVSLTIDRAIAFPNGDNPWDVVCIDDTLTAVTLLLGNSVMLVNRQSSDTLTRIPVGTSPQGMLVDGDDVWVANTGFNFQTFLYDPGTVSVVDAMAGSVSATVPVGTNPQSLDFAPDGTIHVVCTGNFVDQFGIVYIIDPNTKSVTDSLPIGGFPTELRIGPDGNGYLAAGGFSDSGEVFVYDALDRLLLSGPGNPVRTALGVVNVLPRGESGFFALCLSGDSVTEHDSSKALVMAWQVGDGPVAAVHVTNRIPGDIVSDSIIDVFDVVEIVDIAFRNGALPERPGVADVNADCMVNVFDVVGVVDVAFRGGSGLLWGCVTP